jgi:hypothetical protein
MILVCLKSRANYTKPALLIVAHRGLCNGMIVVVLVYKTMRKLLLTLVMLFVISASYAQDKAAKKNQKMMKKSLERSNAEKAGNARKAEKAVGKMEKKQEKINKKAAQLK